MTQASDRYVIASADCHAGASMQDYVPYLDKQWRDDFDSWSKDFVNPFADLKRPSANRNWDNEVRQRDLEADGIAAEVVFPNTVPPFFPSGQLAAYPPRDAQELAMRTAGLKAHNRWLADWCSELPTRRAGLAQVFCSDVDEAVREVQWAADNGLKGVLVPPVAPDNGTPALSEAVYDPLWAACQDLDLTVTQHGGTGIPDFSNTSAPKFLMIMEVPFFANRTLWHMILGGVFERFPKLRLVMTEQRVDWVPPVLRRMDGFWKRFNGAGNVGEMPSDPQQLPNTPSFYFHRNVWMGSSFPSPSEAAAIAEIGPDRVMWGSDYPHMEGTFPHSTEALRHSFFDWEPDVMRDLLGGTCAKVYGFDMDELAALNLGPTPEEVGQPLTDIPKSTSIAFAPVA